MEKNIYHIMFLVDIFNQLDYNYFSNCNDREFWHCWLVMNNVNKVFYWKKQSSARKILLDQKVFTGIYYMANMVVWVDDFKMKHIFVREIVERNLFSNAHSMNPKMFILICFYKYISVWTRQKWYMSMVANCKNSNMQTDANYKN